MQKTKEYEESCYSSSPVFRHGCDDLYMLYTIPKAGLSMNQVREGLFFDSQRECAHNHGQLVKWYTDNKNASYLKSENKLLHDHFRRVKEQKLYDVVRTVHVVQFVRAPSSVEFWNTKVTDARYAWKDGNGFCFIAEGADKFYIIHWGGS